ncbi:MAG: diaminopimelate decarboxylase [Armatimonadetes bacterium]|nr:diaminopimelate decarboxylase [Armatimonadota bacterium]
MNQADPRFRLTDSLARELADRFGTPLYVVDEASVRDRVRQYRTALSALYPKTELSFASKANSTLAVLKIVRQEGATIDVASEGELRAAMLAGIPASDCHLHGNNKKREEIRFALEQGVSHVVIDHFGEIEMVAELLGEFPTRFLLRLAPGVDPKTHSRISTGQSDTKFGFNIADGSAEKALARCLELGIPVDGIHCHVGSQLLDDEAQSAAGEFLAEFAVAMKQRHGADFQHIIIGGGLGVKYTAKDDPLSIEEYCRRVVGAMKPILEKHGLHPTLGMEPGRSIVAEAGVTLYTVGVVKSVPTAPGKTRTYVAVDGGLSDNPRPAMYEAKYDVEAIGHVPGETMTATVCGKHCETDNLFVDVEVPKDIVAGDLLQVLTTGAYNSTMANNYNRYLRPATVLIRQNGKAELVVRRDSWEEMFDKEAVPGDL